MLSGMMDMDAKAAREAAFFELAPAKINLALHVVGQRDDGYHLLESIVTFADAGDRLFFSPSATDGFSVSGRFASLLADAAAGQAGNLGNLVIRARDLLRAELAGRGHAAGPVAIHLEKNLPVAAGIGGGSADAAATLRGLMRVWQVPAIDLDLAGLGLTLGADVPMCLHGEALLVTGIGETLTALPSLPSLALVLANPLVGVSTPEIFRRLTQKNNPPVEPLTTDWDDLLRRSRNDLEPPARLLVEAIGETSALLSGLGAHWVRMSGSGATCFGVFASFAQAEAAAARLAATRPDWYVQAVKTVGAQGEATGERA